VTVPIETVAVLAGSLSEQNKFLDFLPLETIADCADPKQECVVDRLGDGARFGIVRMQRVYVVRLSRRVEGGSSVSKRASRVA